MNYLTSSDAKIILLGSVAGIALELFAYLLSQFFVGNFVFGLSLSLETGYLVASFIFCMVSISLFLVMGVGKSITNIVGAIISGLFVISIILTIGYGIGILVGLALCIMLFAYAGYDTTARTESLLKFSMKSLALPALSSISFGMFILLGGLVFEYVSVQGINTEYFAESIVDQRLVEPVFDSVFDSYGQFSVAERQVIMKETQKTFKTVVSGLLTQANNGIIGPFLGILGVLFFFQIFNSFFIYISFGLVFCIYKLLKITNFVRLETLQKEAEILVI